jgi:hypothetical protein
MLLRAPTPPYDPAVIQGRLQSIIDAPPQLLAAVVWYSQLAPTFGLRWDFALAQAIHETNYGRSPVCVERHNWAGIKVPGSGEYRTYRDHHAGISDHVALLAVYTGLWVPDMVDPTRNTRTPPFAVAAHSEDLNGVWAEGDRYAENIERVRYRIFDAP